MDIGVLHSVVGEVWVIVHVSDKVEFLHLA